MTYEFENVITGEYVEFEYHPDDAPACGEVVQWVDGQFYRRVPSVPPGYMVHRDVAHVSHQLPRTWAGKGPDPAPRRDSMGRPVFHSRRETAEYAAKTGMEYDQL